MMIQNIAEIKLTENLKLTAPTAINPFPVLSVSTPLPYLYPVAELQALKMIQTSRPRLLSSKVTSASPKEATKMKAMFPQEPHHQNRKTREQQGD